MPVSRSGDLRRVGNALAHTPANEEVLVFCCVERREARNLARCLRRRQYGVRLEPHPFEADHFHVYVSSTSAASSEAL